MSENGEGYNYNWVKKNLKEFYFIVFASVVGFLCIAFLAKKEVLIALVPIAAITLLYSLPIFDKKRTIFRLREIPFLKIFLIAFVWSSSTILLPIIHSGNSIYRTSVIAMIVERFFFVFAITIPFDIRDMEADRKAGLKTIPLLISEKKSIIISFLSLFIFFLISFVHYHQLKYWYIIFPLGISTLTTFIFLNSEKIRNLPFYHYGILDGTMSLQGLLVLVFYYVKIIFIK
ncbi:UbiA family prenyltransferase [Fluviicola chungangensis]|uniref:Prenyltransferase n=1 Tax=Fluviicola chungangensis TaxID=2597671 RepID=A0A556MGI7_9FLAO|nr:UbiA family prenyltransferase [Fluviicola chungangensis]TSJ38952.1 hypothetical protein FO442_18530 [Fluviicola chungangensis]